MEFKIGDRVLLNDKFPLSEFVRKYQYEVLSSYVSAQGNNRCRILLVPSLVTHTGDYNGFNVNEINIELDKEYYRDLSLNKILEDENS